MPRYFPKHLHYSVYLQAEITHFSRLLSMLGFSDFYKTFSNLILSVASLAINVADCLYADMFIGHLYFLTSLGRVGLGRFPQPGWF